MKKFITNDASKENARLIIENARLQEIIKEQGRAIGDIEALAVQASNKNILEITSVLRRELRRRVKQWHSL